MGSVYTKETKNLKKPLGGIIIGIAFLLLGTAWILRTESAFDKLLGSILIIATLVHTAYYSAMFIKRLGHKKLPFSQP